MPTSRAGATSRWPVSSTRWWSLSRSGNGCGVSGSWRCTGPAGRQRRCAPARSSARGWSTSSGSSQARRCDPSRQRSSSNVRSLEWSAPPGTQGADRRVPTPASGSIATRPADRVPVPQAAPRPIPKIRYTTTDDGVNLAYQVTGDGPVDLIIVPGYVSHLDTWWEAPSGQLVRRLAEFCRLILFDKRGMGLSDRPPRVDVEHWMEDTRVVLDAVGSERAVVMGVTAGGLIATLFAATYPERIRSLVLCGSFARQLRNDDDYPIGLRAEDVEAHIAYTQARWGSGVGLRLYCPSVGDDPVAREQYSRYQRPRPAPAPPAPTCGARPDRRAPRTPDDRRPDPGPARQARPRDPRRAGAVRRRADPRRDARRVGQRRSPDLVLGCAGRDDRRDPGLRHRIPPNSRDPPRAHHRRVHR